MLTRRLESLTSLELFPSQFLHCVNIPFNATSRLQHSFLILTLENVHENEIRNNIKQQKLYAYIIECLLETRDLSFDEKYPNVNFAQCSPFPYFI